MESSIIVKADVAPNSEGGIGGLFWISFNFKYFFIKRPEPAIHPLVHLVEKSLLKFGKEVLYSDDGNGMLILMNQQRQLAILSRSPHIEIDSIASESGPGKASGSESCRLPSETLVTYHSSLAADLVVKR